MARKKLKKQNALAALLAELLKGTPAELVKRLGFVGGAIVAGTLWYQSVEDLKAQVARVEATQEIILFYQVFEHGEPPQGPLSPSQRALLLRLLGKEAGDGSTDD